MSRGRKFCTIGPENLQRTAANVGRDFVRRKSTPTWKYRRNPADWKTGERISPSRVRMQNEMRRFSEPLREQMFGAGVVNFSQLQPAWHS
jgi:hypothetical protein